jgi:hypothetical protein
MVGLLYGRFSPKHQFTLDAKDTATEISITSPTAFADDDTSPRGANVKNIFKIFSQKNVEHYDTNCSYLGWKIALTLFFKKKLLFRKNGKNRRK